MTTNPVSRRTVLGGMAAAAVATALPVTVPMTARADTGLWRLGNIGPGAGSSTEFAEYGMLGDPQVVPVPNDWATRTSWNEILTKGLRARNSAVMKVTYNLASVPANGVRFETKIVFAHRSIPQMAVFSNRTMVGMIQITGLHGAQPATTYPETYQLYIPKEFLRVGSNELQLEAVPSFSASDTEMDWCYWEWDYLRLIALGAPATEPIHGRYVHLGTTIAKNRFDYDDDAVKVLPYMLVWLGIAYSGNVMRVGFWSNDEHRWNVHSHDYLEMMRLYNMRVVANHLDPRRTGYTNPDGSLTDAARDKLTAFLTEFHGRIQYYEVDNEPGLFESPQQSNIDIAGLVRDFVIDSDSHLEVVAPGWAYADWAADVAARRTVETSCDLTNGHSYGQSYAQHVNGNGASFLETIETYAPITNGLPKQMLVTETGTTNGHVDNPHLEATQPKAAAFDRILRAHLGFADHIMQHAAFFPDHELFDIPTDWAYAADHPQETTAFRFDSTQQTRVEIFRRLALAYATHGAPLTYTYLNAAALEYAKVYTRVVNTATLAPLPGNNATANKVLINIVNFENVQRTVQLRVVMPNSGTWSGRRFRAGDSWASAQLTVSVTAAPTTRTIDLTLTLAAFEAVQYILGQ